MIPSVGDMPTQNLRVGFEKRSFLFRTCVRRLQRQTTLMCVGPSAGEEAMNISGVTVLCC